MADENMGVAVLGARMDDLARRVAEGREETNRRLDGVNNHMERRFHELNESIHRLQFVPRETYELLVRRVEELEEGRKWFARALVVSFILPIAVILFLQATVGST